MSKILSTVVGEVRAHAVGYSVWLAFVLAGPIAVQLIFPQASSGLVMIGGVAFGVFAGVSAVPEKFL
jgi:hypothetical protein